MEVSVQKKEVVAAICVTFNEDDITKMLELAKKWKYHDAGLFLQTILCKADVIKPETDSTMWYVTICGNNHTLADAVGTIRSLLPIYASGITSPANWFNAREVCVGMWKEQSAKKVQKLLSDKGFEASLIKAGDCQ